MDAIIFLRQEHSKFRKTLSSIHKIKNEKLKLRKFNTFTHDLLRHEKMEEKIWYPVLRRKIELRDIIQHLVSEEKSAEKSIKSIKQTPMGFIWKLKFIKFKFDVDHHASEEEKQLFIQVRKYFSKDELNKLGIKMKKFKKNIA